MKITCPVSKVFCSNKQNNPKERSNASSSIVTKLMAGVCFAACTLLSPAQSVDDYRSYQTGNWNSTSTWERWNGSAWINPAPSTPSSSNGAITIMSPHTITVSASVTIDQTTINFGGALQVSSGQTLTVVDGSGTDVAVNGILLNSGTITLSGSPVVDINSAATYRHAVNSATVPAVNFNTGSTFMVTGVSSVFPTMPSSVHHVFWNCPFQAFSGNFISTNTTINGNLTVSSTGSGEIGISSGTARSLTIKGNFQMTGGTMTLARGTATPTVTVSGNLDLSGGTLNAASSTGVPSFSLAGNFLNNGGTFNPGTGTNSITLNGTSAQTIGGTTATTFNGLVINNSSSTGVTLSKDVTINTFLTFTDGYVYTAASPNGLLTLIDGAIVGNGTAAEAGNASSFVDGPVRKRGNDAFTFPVGDDVSPSGFSSGDKWGRIEITAPSNTTTEYTAQYFANSYSVVAVAAPLNNVSLMEYWTLDQAVNNDDVQVKLYWENYLYSGINDCSTTDLRVAHYNSSASQWELDVSTVNVSGGCASGSVSGTVQTAAVQPNYSPFTFGSMSPTFNPLPISLTSFTALCNEKQQVDLNWEVASQHNNDLFTVEKSVDGFVYQELAKIAGAGTTSQATSYSYTDVQASGAAYYRLSQTDQNGLVEYLKVVGTTCNENNNLIASPNPANDNIVINAENNATLVIYDLTGKTVFTGFLPGGKSALDIHFLSAGLYQLQMNTAAGSQWQKLVVNR